MPTNFVTRPNVTCRHRPTCAHGVAAHPEEVRCHLKSGNCPRCEARKTANHYRTSTGAAMTQGDN